MSKKTVLVTVLLCAGSAFGGAMFVQAPAENINPHKHPNLAAAQSFIVQAYRKVDEAQQANKDELGGHGEKAKEFLSRADAELKLAAEVSNKEGR
jgi:hypothetical protein